MLRRGGAGRDPSGYNKLQNDSYDASDDGGSPRILSWVEDLQSATNNIESRLKSLEHVHMKSIESTEMTK